MHPEITDDRIATGGSTVQPVNAKSRNPLPAAWGLPFTYSKLLLLLISIGGLDNEILPSLILPPFGDPQPSVEASSLDNEILPSLHFTIPFGDPQPSVEASLLPLRRPSASPFLGDPQTPDREPMLPPIHKSASPAAPSGATVVLLCGPMPPVREASLPLPQLLVMPPPEETHSQQRNHRPFQSSHWHLPPLHEELSSFCWVLASTS